MVRVVKQRRDVLYGGLSNQMMGFFGLMLVAQRRNTVMLLPQWRTSYPDHAVVTANMSAVWGEISWPKHFPRMVDSVSQVAVDKTLTRHGFAMLGKFGQCCWADVSPHPFKLPLYTDILKPRPELQQYVDDFIRQYGTTYGSLHARVEGDMRKHLEKRSRSQFMIGLSHILEVMNNSTLRKVDTLFIAAGDDLLPEDREVLDRGMTPWGGRIVRSSSLQATHLTYLDRSIIDMAICTHGAYFVGNGGSTFSLMIAIFKRQALESKLQVPLPSYFYSRHTLTPAKRLMLDPQQS